MESKKIKIAYILMNKILSRFGLRIMKGERIIFLLRIPDYDTNRGTKWSIYGKATYVIEVTKDISKAFDFLNIDKNIIDRLENMMHFTYYFIGNCPYLTMSVINGIEKEIEDSPVLYKGDPEVKQGLEEFLHFAKLSELRPNEFDFYPFLIYPGLKERVVRNFFKEKEFNDRIVVKKVEHQEDFNLYTKYNSMKLRIWIPDLIDDPELAGNFSLAFVNHVTAGKLKEFPKYLVDTPKNVIRREVEAFYEFIYKVTPEYINHVVDGKDNENVL